MLWDSVSEFWWMWKANWDCSIPCLAPQTGFPRGGNHCFPWERTAQLKEYPLQTPPPHSYILHPLLLLLGALFGNTRTHLFKEIISKCLQTPPSPHNHYNFINPLKHLLLLTEDLKYFLPFFSKILFFGKLWSWYVPTSILHYVGFLWVLSFIHCWCRSSLKKAQIFLTVAWNATSQIPRRAKTYFHTSQTAIQCFYLSQKLHNPENN